MSDSCAAVSHSHAVWSESFADIGDPAFQIRPGPTRTYVDSMSSTMTNMAVVALPEKIVSGGQTGVDRAALDAAIEFGMELSGWCPRGRRAEDGQIHRRYPLRETPSRNYSQRTEWNVRDSDATLILCRGSMSGGTLLTMRLAERYERPLLVLDLDRDPEPKQVREWIREQRVGVLNVAGPREEGAPGTYDRALVFLRRALG